MSAEPPEKSAPSLELLKAQIILSLVFALVWTIQALQQSPRVGAIRFLNPLLFCYAAALAWFQMRRHTRGESLRQPPPMLLRLIGLVFCAFLTFCLCDLPIAGWLRVLLYIGLAAFWAVIFLLGKRYREMDKERPETPRR